MSRNTSNQQFPKIEAKFFADLYQNSGSIKLSNEASNYFRSLVVDHCCVETTELIHDSFSRFLLGLDVQGFVLQELYLSFNSSKKSFSNTFQFLDVNGDTVKVGYELAMVVAPLDFAGYFAMAFLHVIHNFDYEFLINGH